MATSCKRLRRPQSWYALVECSPYTPALVHSNRKSCWKHLNTSTPLYFRLSMVSCHVCTGTTLHEVASQILLTMTPCPCVVEHFITLFALLAPLLFFVLILRSCPASHVASSPACSVGISTPRYKMTPSTRSSDPTAAVPWISA